MNAEAAIELLPQNLVLLAETVQFTSQIVVLALETVRVLLKCFLLIGEVILIAAILLILATERLDVTAGGEEGVFLVFETQLGVTDLNGQITVAVLLAFEVLARLEVFSGESVIVTAEGGAFSRKVGNLFASASQFSAGVAELAFFAADVR